MICFLTENTNKYDYMPNNWAARKKNEDRNKKYHNKLRVVKLSMILSQYKTLI